MCMTVSIETVLTVLTLVMCALPQGFDEVRRLGLQQETEVVVRAAKACSHGAPGGALRPGSQYGDSVMAREHRRARTTSSRTTADRCNSGHVDQVSSCEAYL